MNKITIVEKPDWVSWNDIHDVLVAAHADNKLKGIVMQHQRLSGEEIKQELGSAGVMIIALDGQKVVGVAAIEEKIGKQWYLKGRYGYLCFAGVLPDYRGKGIYTSLIKKREQKAKELNYNLLAFDTHKDNLIVQEIAQKNGYRLVRYFRAQTGDHFNVAMVKWLNGQDAFNKKVKQAYCLSKLLTIIQFKRNGKERTRLTTLVCQGINRWLKVK